MVGLINFGYSKTAAGNNLKMKPHHAAWLSNHPTRSAEWLSARLADGFDVHHLDGDHTNNSPENLILVECQDHSLTLHSLRMIRPIVIRPCGRKPSDGIRDAAIYRARCDTRNDWRVIAKQFGVTTKNAMQSAKRVARLKGWEWPIVGERWTLEQAGQLLAKALAD